MIKNKYLSLFLILLITFIASAIGGFTTASFKEPWYSEIALPSYNPPSWVFGPVWTILYIMMSIAIWKIWIDFYDKKIREGLVKEDICTIQLNNGIYKTFCPSYCEITEINDSKNTIEKCVNICSINDLSAEQTDIKFSINQLNEFLNNLNSDEENINLTINDFS